MVPQKKAFLESRGLRTTIECCGFLSLSPIISLWKNWFSQTVLIVTFRHPVAVYQGAMHDPGLIWCLDHGILSSFCSVFLLRYYTKFTKKRNKEELPWPQVYFSILLDPFTLRLFTIFGYVTMVTMRKPLFQFFFSRFSIHPFPWTFRIPLSYRQNKIYKHSINSISCNKPKSIIYMARPNLRCCWTEAEVYIRFLGWFTFQFFSETLLFIFRTHMHWRRRKRGCPFVKPWHTLFVSQLSISTQKHGIV